MAGVEGTGRREVLPSDGGMPIPRTGARHTGGWVLRTNSVSFYLRSRIVLRPDRLLVVVHRTILGLVPVGKVTREVSLADLKRVAVRLVVWPWRLAVAVGLTAVAIVLEPPTAVAVMCVVLALALLFLGIALGIRVEERSGSGIVVPVCVLQRGVAMAAVRQIERAVGAGRAP